MSFSPFPNGDKKKLLDLSILNVKQYKADRMKTGGETESGTEKYAPDERNTARNCIWRRPPLQIECFDNSNIQGL